MQQGVKQNWVKGWLSVIVGIALFALGVSTSYAIKINGLMDIWPEGAAVFSKKLTNTGDTAAYYQVGIQKTLNLPEVLEGKPEKTQTLTPQAMADSLFPAPDKLAVLPHHSQTVKFFFPKGRHNSEEEYYHLNFVPITAAQFNAGASAAKSDGKVGVQMAVGIGLGAKLVVPPVQRNYQVVVNKQANTLVVHNQGNSSVIVWVYGQAGSAAKPQPVSIGRVAYPKYDRKINVAGIRKINVVVEEGKKRVAKYFN